MDTETRTIRNEPQTEAPAEAEAPIDEELVQLTPPKGRKRIVPSQMMCPKNGRQGKLAVPLH